MSDMQSFVMFFLNNLPTFLMAEPIIYIVGLLIAGVVVNLIFRIVNLR